MALELARGMQDQGLETRNLCLPGWMHLSGGDSQIDMGYQQMAPGPLYVPGLRGDGHWHREARMSCCGLTFQLVMQGCSQRLPGLARLPLALRGPFPGEGKAASVRPLPVFCGLLGKRKKFRTYTQWPGSCSPQM